MKNFTIINAIMLAITFAAFSTFGNSLAMQQPLTKKQLNEQLIEASGAGDVAKIKKLLNDGADINAFIDWHTPISKAIVFEQINSVKALLDAGVKPLTNINETSSPLSFALGIYASKNSDDMTVSKNIFKELLSRVTPAELNQISSNGYIPLFEAVEIGDPAATVLLLAAGADPLLRAARYKTACYGEWRGFTPIDLAKGIGRRQNIRVILENFLVTPEEVNYINTGILSLKQAAPKTFVKDVRGIMRSLLIQNVIEEKMKKIKDALAGDKWGEIDKDALQKALKINIRKALSGTPEKKEAS